MTNKMNIHVSGGNVSLGSVSQGDATHVSGTAFVIQEEAEQRFHSAQQEVRALAEALRKTNAEVEAVLVRMATLKEHALIDPGNTKDGVGILKAIRENFSWAYPAIKDFAQAVWPVLLSEIGT